MNVAYAADVAYAMGPSPGGGGGGMSQTLPTLVMFGAMNVFHVSVERVIRKPKKRAAAAKRPASIRKSNK